MSDPKDPQNQKILSYIMAKHAPLVQKHINSLRANGKIPQEIEDEDLHFAGFHGVLDAFHKYSHFVAERALKDSDDNPFAKYAGRRIQGKILDHIASVDEVPKTIKTKIKNLGD